MLVILLNVRTSYFLYNIRTAPARKKDQPKQKKNKMAGCRAAVLGISAALAQVLLQFLPHYKDTEDGLLCN